MEISGKLKMIGETQQVSASFRKREVVVTTEEQYPQDILVEFQQDKCDLLNSFYVTQDVTIGLNLRGREWVNPQGEKRYFNSIQGWRIDAQQQPQPQQQGYGQQQGNYNQQPQNNNYPPAPNFNR